MILIKHLLDPVESTDGQRLWVEPIGVTLDLKEWCRVDHLLTHLGPPKRVWDWFQKHPEGYDYFRAKYHEALARGPYKDALVQLVSVAQSENFTLLHQGSDPAHNSATALYEFLSELEARLPRPE
jgi:uncharacterized protein YeaO (DUF488 family)